MRTSRVASLIAAGAISLPLLASTTSPVAVSPRTMPLPGTQLAELKGSDTVAQDDFGYPVAVSGTTAVVGAPGHSEVAGRAYVFARTAAGWKQAAELSGSDTIAGDAFGYSVAVSGATAVVGAPIHGDAGSAYVFTKIAGRWKQVAELEGSGTVIQNEFGYSVSISGRTVIVGAPFAASDALLAGQVYVFTETATGWRQTAELEGSGTIGGDQFGVSVAISARTVIVGANYRAQSQGRAYVFTETATGWRQTTELKSSNGGNLSGDEFGSSVAISGTTVVVSAVGAQRAYIFTKKASDWKGVAEMTGADTTASDYFGDSVAISGTTVVVGAPLHLAGRAYLFTKTANGWKQIAELEGSDVGHTSSEFGYSVAVSGRTVVVGAPGRATFAGRAYVFEA